MKISLYTAMKDCIRWDYPFLEMIHHHLPLVDEFVINEGFSSDGTYEAIRDLDSKIKIFRTHWEKPTGEDWWIHFKDESRRRCTGDWCIHLDCDEFIPEWEFSEIKKHMALTDDVLISTRFTNFYGNYRVYHSDPASVNWITRKMNFHRNVDFVEFWGDGSNLKESGKPFSWDLSSREFNVHHFGAVRSAARLRESWWSAGRFRIGKSIRIKPPRFMFDLFPHKWIDNDYMNGLSIYEGPFIKPVNDNSSSFIRDNLMLYELLLERDSGKLSNSQSKLQ